MKEQPFLGTWLICAALSVLVVACSEEESPQPTLKPTPWVEELVGYNLLLPSFIPPDVSDPTVRVDEERRIVKVRYAPMRGREGASAPDIELTQNPARVIFADKVDDPALRELDLAGTAVVMQETRGTAGSAGFTASAALQWYQSGFSMTAHFAWLSGTGERLELTDEMRDVAVNVVESIIRAPDVSARH